MPAGDGTGPMGQGAMTGRGAGYCAGNDVAGYENAPGGAGFRRGGGFGRRGGGFGGGGRRGNRNQFNATGLYRWQREGLPQATDRTAGLQQQVNRLEGMINGLRDQLAKLMPKSDD